MISFILRRSRGGYSSQYVQNKAKELNSKRPKKKESNVAWLLLLFEGKRKRDATPSLLSRFCDGFSFFNLKNCSLTEPPLGLLRGVVDGPLRRRLRVLDGAPRGGPDPLRRGPGRGRRVVGLGLETEPALFDVRLGLFDQPERWIF